MIFILCNVDHPVELENAHENYKPVFGATVISKKKSFYNQLTILFSERLISQNLSPIQKNLNIDPDELNDDFTMNNKIFMLFGH